MPTTTRFLLSLFLLLIVLQSGCSRVFVSKKSFYRTVTGDVGANTEIAKEKNEQAIACLQSGNLTKAQQLCHEALVSDPAFGPAHNTLGKVYFQQRKYYLAAWEYEYANHAMPERVEPLNNIGLVYEKVGRFDQAIAFYEEAHARSPDTPEVLGNLIRAKLARGDTPFSMQDQIKHLILIDNRPEWVSWAKLKLFSDDTEAKILRDMHEDGFGTDSTYPYDSNRFENFEEIHPEIAPGYGTNQRAPLQSRN